MYSNVCEILNICRILVDRLAGVTDEEGRGGRRCEQIWADRAARCKSVRFTEKATLMPRKSFKNRNA